MDQLDNTGKVDPVDLIREIRKGRYNLVQRTAQYKLAWQACVNYARGLLQVRPRGGTIMSISTESEMSSKMSAKLRRQSMAKTGDWDVQYIDGTCTDDSLTFFFLSTQGHWWGAADSVTGVQRFHYPRSSRFSSKLPHLC